MTIKLSKITNSEFNLTFKNIKDAQIKKKNSIFKNVKNELNHELF